MDSRKSSNTTKNKFASKGKYNKNNEFDWNDIVESTMCSSEDEFTPLQGEMIKSCEENKKENRSKNSDNQDNFQIIDKMDDMDDPSDLDILNTISLLARNLKFQYKKKFNEDVETCIHWLVYSLECINKTCAGLMKKNNQDIQSNNKKNGPLSRNSYKFCEYGYDCRFNYSEDSHCYSQHYVYNLVSSDIEHLLAFINKIDEFDDGHYNEIRISINTITYVINHMYEELNKLKNYRREKYEKI